MFRKVEALDSSWRILIMGDLTVKTVSYSLKKSEAHDLHVSDFENLYKIRRPYPSVIAVYFIQPTEENVDRFLLDMAGKSPLYRKYKSMLLLFKPAFLFFSSRLSKELRNRIKSCATLKGRLGQNLSVKTCLVEHAQMNLEYLVIDSLGFVTHNEGASEELLGNEEYTCKGIACLNAMAARIATVFVSLKEFPLVCYRAAKSLDATTMTTLRDLVPTKLAAAVYDLLDRSVDQTAPVIHKWIYNAMCRDLLNMEGKKVRSKSGGPLKKEEFLLEDDPIGLEHHAHIGEVFERVHEKTYDCENTTLAQFESSPRAELTSEFVNCNCFYNYYVSYKLVWCYRGGTEVPIPKLFKLVKALPDHIERKEKLGRHAEIAGELFKIIMKFGLQELGQQEQDLVFGDAGIKDVIKYLESKDDTISEHKLRLLMIVAAICPEVFEGETGYSLMKLAKLQPSDMNAVNNMRLLGGHSSDTQKSLPSSTFSKSDIHVELVEKFSKGELSKEDYPGPRIFVFIAGGATRSELRVCHKLTTKLKRQVVQGSSSLDDPATFITKLKLLKGHEDGSDC
ncbi:hypothetical protein TIFTF001_000035 [Ficus carica]|uniref:Uncharacterized protein n=1 Tax=Ficus carica TaxID=3494 RepID=A0AA87Z7W1_FICCA|nr:hypothetical protein TIFTF001_000035 [Ficus carica]